MSTQQQFTIGERVQVVNIQADGTPGANHGCTCRISRFFTTDDGQRAAQVLFIGVVEKKISLDKLQKIDPLPDVEIVSPYPRPTHTPRLPIWVRPDWSMVRGDALQKGDLVYFSPRANPRELQEQRSLTAWHGVTIAEYRGFEKRYPGSIEINPVRWYVVERKAVAK